MRNSLFAVALVAVLLSACASAAEPEPDPETATVEAPTLKLFVFDCGSIGLNEDSIELFSLTLDDVVSPQLFVPCYLIEHSGTRLLWEAGLPASVADNPDGVASEIQSHPLFGTLAAGAFLERLERPLADQLADLGIDGSDIDFVAFSHMHFDHVGQMNQFTDSTLLIQRAEHEAAFAEELTVPFTNPLFYADLEDNETILLDGDHDVFGDGRVVIKSTPGHTPGHQSLFIDLANTGPIVLSGDLFHFPANRELRRVPRFNVDAATTLASMDALDTFIEETGAELWISHNWELSRNLRLAPEFYD